MTCPHTGCNMPESECRGACMERRPPKHFKPQTTQQRLAVLRRIDETEFGASSDLMMLEERSALSRMHAIGHDTEPEAQPEVHNSTLWKPAIRVAAAVVLFVIFVTFSAVSG